MNLELTNNERTAAVDALCRLIEVPSVPSDGEAVDRAVGMLTDRMRDAGFAVDTLRIDDGNPVVVGEVGPKDAYTVLIYGHYDVFPADADEGWSAPPFEPRLDGDRLYGRGAGDNKGQILAHLEAIRLYRERHGELPVRVKMVIEGEEEIGSKSLPKIARAHADRLAADLVLYSDGPMFRDDRPMMVFGARGALVFEVVATGANCDLHSGNFGGVMPSPTMDLCRFLAALCEPDGRLRVPGLAETGVQLTNADRAALEDLPDGSAAVADELGVEPLNARYGDGFYERLCRRHNLNVASLGGGTKGESFRSVIPNEARAFLDLRLVGDQDPETAFEHLERFAQDQGLNSSITLRKHIAQPPSRTRLDHPSVPAIAEAVQTGFGQRPLHMPSLAATTPDWVFTRVLEAPSVIVPFAPHDENNHAPDESTRLSLFVAGIRTSMTALDRLGGRSG
jgi:acetylornithine deacetylase/succinyl-diaminopimelate desuccinylase-like protein